MKQTKNMNQFWIVTHHHEFGETSYLVESDHKPSQNEIVKHVLESEFEPDREEWINLEVAGPLKQIPPRRRKVDKTVPLQ